MVINIDNKIVQVHFGVEQNKRKTWKKKWKRSCSEEHNRVLLTHIYNVSIKFIDFLSPPRRPKPQEGQNKARSDICWIKRRHPSSCTCQNLLLHYIGFAFFLPWIRLFVPKQWKPEKTTKITLILVAFTSKEITIESQKIETTMRDAMIVSWRLNSRDRLPLHIEAFPSFFVFFCSLLDRSACTCYASKDLLSSTWHTSLIAHRVVPFFFSVFSFFFSNVFFPMTFLFVHRTGRRLRGATRHNAVLGAHNGDSPAYPVPLIHSLLSFPIKRILFIEFLPLIPVATIRLWTLEKWWKSNPGGYGYQKFLKINPDTCQEVRDSYDRDLSGCGSTNLVIDQQSCHPVPLQFIIFPQSYRSQAKFISENSRNFFLHSVFIFPYFSQPFVDEFSVQLSNQFTNVILLRRMNFWSNE